MLRAVFSFLLVALPTLLTVCPIRTLATESPLLASNEVPEDQCIATAPSLEDGSKLKAMAVAMHRGQWLCAKTIVESARTSLVLDYRGTFEMEQRLILREIAQLKSAIESSLPMPSINCPFKWAQSSTEIVLSVKFSHKIDAPATLNVVAKNVTLTSDRLILQASNGAKNFNLDIDFMGSIIPNESSWSMASVGRMTFNIKKEQSPSKWAGLTKGNKKLPQMHFWWEIQEKFSDELDKLGEENHLSDSPASASSIETLADSAADMKTTAAIKPLKSVDGIVEESPRAIPDDSGRIISEEEMARKIEDKKVLDEIKAKINAATESARSRKKEIDLTAKREKDIIDTEMANLLSDFEQQKNAITSVSKSKEDFTDDKEL